MDDDPKESRLLEGAGVEPGRGIAGSLKSDIRTARRLRKRFRREREALRFWSAEQTKIENGTWHEQAPKNDHVRDGVDGNIASTRRSRTDRIDTLRRTGARRVGSAHRGRARCSRRSRPAHDRRRQTAARPRSRSQHRRQGSRGVEGVLQLVHGAQSGGLESGLSGEVLQRRQLAPAISHARTSTTDSSRRRATIEHVAVPG